MNAPIDAALAKALASVTLDDKYTLERGRAFMSGTQALVRLPMLQRQRDERNGLNTAGFISGYRGSPLGGLDQSLWKAKKQLDANRIVFQPGLNEDLAATSIWGSQQVNLSKHANVDGVFSMWYGKGPGVDRCGDVFKHANAAGTSRYGGVIVLAGDDHGAKSSTLPHQSDHIFKACGLPVFYPSSAQEYLDLGMHGWAMSRWSGLWVAMKTVTEVVEAASSVIIDPDRVQIEIPPDFVMPDDPHGLNIRWPDSPLEQEARLLDYKFYAALAYVRHNKLNHTVIDSDRAWLGIITGGKAYLDTRQALEDLGLDAQSCAQIGIRVFKCGVVWPLEAQTVREFATGLEEILVVEEKRQMLEYALKEELYNWRDDVRPKIYGKFDEKDGLGGEWSMPMGKWLLPAHAELSPAMIAKAIASRLLNPGKYGSRFALDADRRRRIEERVAIIEAKERALALPHVVTNREPTFCSGCPHNTSTHVPEGSRAVAGIGCHYMATWMPERRTETFTQMGGEGVPWIGQAPFTDETHIFANLGDGTYFHSGILAIRASIAAKVNITYKILYNDAVAMTGGQPLDGTLTVPQVVAQLAAEGASKIVIATDEPDKYDAVKSQPIMAGIEIHHRDHLDWLQKQLREIKGCTILIYDQTCASEKRRRRKKIVNGVPGFPDPAKRVIINEAVCEGCGDCTVQSSCVSVEPLETELGRKRKINQSSCNKDYSCVKGFCPSFVTVEGGALRKGTAGTNASAAAAASAAEAGSAGNGGVAVASLPAKIWRDLPEPQIIKISESGNRSYGILVTGIGGTGVVTIGQLLGMAAHLEGRGISVLDMAGLAQKGGAVFSHVQLAESQSELFSTRIATGEADLLIGCDLIVSASNEALSKLRRTVTRAVINADVSPTSDFLRDPNWQAPEEELKHNILEAAGAQDVDFFDANELALALTGDALFTNPLLLGYAWQKGWIPLTRQALERAIELNAIAVKANLEAFIWGRRCAHDLDEVKTFAGIDVQLASNQSVANQPASNQPASKQPSSKPQIIEFKRMPGTVTTEQDLEQMIAKRVQWLSAYQNAAYAQRYRDLVARVRAAERSSLVTDGKLRLTEAVARYYYKLLAYKDEYEVARLHSDPAFSARIAQQFEGDYTLKFHLAPPLIARVDAKTGKPRKIEFGSYMMSGFRVLAKLRFLRGTPFDIFGYSHERRTERALIGEYEAIIAEMLPRLTTGTRAAAVDPLILDIARYPEGIRGYGHVKERHLLEAKASLEAKLKRLRVAPADRARTSNEEAIA